MIKQEILDAFNFRHACKSFNAEKKISDEDFNFIMETARLSPSTFGSEPWHFLVVQDMEKRKALSGSFWGGDGKWQTASHLVFILARKERDMTSGSKYLDHIIKDVHGIPEEVAKQMTIFLKKFQEEDYKLTSREGAITDWSVRQTYIPLANMMTAAALIGIDSCPMEGFNREDMDNILSSEFGFDKDEFTLSCVAAFGYREKEPHAKSRQKMEDIVTYIK